MQFHPQLFHNFNVLLEVFFDTRISERIGKLSSQECKLNLNTKFDELKKGISRAIEIGISFNNHTRIDVYLETLQCKYPLYRTVYYIVNSSTFHRSIKLKF